MRARRVGERRAAADGRGGSGDTVQYYSILYHRKNEERAGDGTVHVYSKVECSTAIRGHVYSEYTWTRVVPYCS